MIVRTWGGASMMACLRPWALLLWLAACGFARAQSGGAASMLLAVDPATGYVANADVTALEPDGELLAAGIVSYDASGLPVEGLMLFTADGSVDPTFNAASLAARSVSILLALPNGQVLAVGTFGPLPAAGDSDPERIVRLDADGTVDPAFNASALRDTSIDSLWIQPGGGILLCVAAVDAAGNVQQSFLRLNSDGSADATFQPPPDMVATVLDGDLVVQPDGKLVVFSGSEGDDAEPALLRLNADGTRDTTFNAALAPGAYITALALQPDGKLLAGQEAAMSTATPGGQVNPGGPLLTTTYQDSMIRLDADGSADSTFATVTLDGEAAGFGLEPDGQVLIEGDFATVAGSPRNGVARINADGTLDSVFNPLSATADAASHVFVLADGSIFLAYTTTSSASPATVLDRFQEDGTLASQQTLAGTYALDVTGPGPAYFVLESALSPLPTGGGPIVVPVPKPVVTLTAVHRRIGADGSRCARFFLTRTGSVAEDLTVAYTAGGTAASGRDYEPLKGMRTIHAGKSRARIRIEPIGDRLGRLAARGKATIKLSIAAGAAYEVGTPSRARVKIVNGPLGGAGE